MAIDTTRTHDRIYLDENRYEEPKEMFKWIAAKAAAADQLLPGRRAVDFGCAAGEFLFYLSKIYPGLNYYGFDILPELVDKATNIVKGPKFSVGSVLDEELMEPDSIDVAFLFGVLSIFDDFRPALLNLIKWTRPKGRIYVFGAFNSQEIDVWVKYKRFDDPDSNHREPGWNIFSQKSVSQFVEDQTDAESCVFKKFEIPIDISANPNDAVRSWTLRDKDGHRLSLNGLSLFLDLQLLEITVGEVKRQ